MTHQRAQQRKGPWLTEVVEGDPLQVGGRELVPLVRVRSRVHRRASLGNSGIGGRGYGFVHMRPVAILEKGKDGEHRYQIPNETARTIEWLALAALLIPGLAILLVYLSRRLAGRRPLMSA